MKVNKSYARAVFGVTILFSLQCQPPSQSDSKQVFSDAKRTTISHAQAPYILRLANQCTAYIIDKTKLIGVTADHCNAELNMQLCFGAADIRAQSCPYPATVTKFIEDKSTTPQASLDELDYAVFEFQFQGAVPTNMKELKLSGTDALLTKALNEKVPLALVGYPADSVQNGQLTRSDCNARLGMQLDASADSKNLINTWETNAKYKNDPEYAAMRQACLHINTDPGKYRPTFIADCSVYGGNSGGPLKFADYDVVLGMPATYLPSPDTPVPEADCIEKYWDKFFAPLSGMTKDQVIAEGKKERQNWNKLDRSTTDVEAMKATFPREIPMHFIVAKSPFFKANMQYVATELSGSNQGVAGSFNLWLSSSLASNQADLWISTNHQIAKLALCYGTLTDCQKSAREDVAFIGGKADKSAANFFLAKKAFTFDKLQSITVLGFDAQGKVAYAQQKDISPH